LKKDLDRTMPVFLWWMKKKRDFILKKPAAATHPTSRAKLAEVFILWWLRNLYMTNARRFLKASNNSDQSQRKITAVPIDKMRWRFKKPIFYVKNSKDFIYFYNRLSSKQKVWDSVNEKKWRANRLRYRNLCGFSTMCYTLDNSWENIKMKEKPQVITKCEKWKKWWKFSMILFCGVQWWRLCWEQCSVAQKRDPSGQIKFSRVSLVLPVRLPFWGEWLDRNFPRQIVRESPCVFEPEKLRCPPQGTRPLFFNEMLSPLPPKALNI